MANFFYGIKSTSNNRVYSLVNWRNDNPPRWSVGLAWFASGGPYWNGFGGWTGGMMGSYHGFVDSSALNSFYSAISILGLFSGIVIVISAVMLWMRPQDHLIWGILILVFGLVSFADMGSYFIGAILGIIGGAFAISYRPSTMTT